MNTDPDAVQRWRLILGADPENGPGAGLTEEQLAMDAALASLYDSGDEAPGERKAGLGASAPRVARWLGDIRTYFPSRVVRVMQSDAIERLGLRRLLLEPEMLATVEPDVHLVATLASLRGVIPEKSKATAREVVGKVARDVEQRLADRMRQAVRGALNRANRVSRPRLNDIDWNRTVRANLKHYLPEYRTVVPQRLVGFGRRQQGVQREVVLCVDQSGSMAASVVYASILASVMASIRALKTHLVVYDTAVVDLTDQLSDPVDVIFGTQLGGGTDTTPALEHCQRLITSPRRTVLLLITDLYDSDPERMLAKLTELEAGGVVVVVLLALSDEGKPGYSAETAQRLADLGIPAFACTPDAFPELIALAINHGDIRAWSQKNEAAAAHGR
ncbi:MAG: VWA domain-containing protein [Propionibacteriaceae bacterium]|nr:VWA domain-containing protein [Propionibacteriaceae bacterium]